MVGDGENSENSISMIKKGKVAYKDAVVIDVMRDKASAVIGSYTDEMKQSIKNELYQKD